MNYRHIFHAGNFADVLKHLVLLEIINYLKQKPSPFFYLDTHAGIGLYDLSSEQSKKTTESEHGILKIAGARNAPQLVMQYLEIIHKINPNKEITLYPGSPVLAHQLLRENDRMALCEWHPEDYDLLRQVFYHKLLVAVHHLDGYLGLKALLPPKERRGLVLIDPPYENPNECQLLLAGLQEALHRFSHGIYAIWYPIKMESNIPQMIKKISKEFSHEKLIIEFFTGKKIEKTELEGMGMLIINPPWQLETNLYSACDWLIQFMQNNIGHYYISHH